MDAASLGLDEALSAFADTALGGGLSPQVDALIAQAGQLRDRPLEALPLLEQARAAGEDALAIARTALGPDFGDEPPDDESARYDAAVRFYLFTLKGLAYLNLRLGDLEDAHLLLGELRRLDPGDRVGGALLAHVLERHEQGEESGLDGTPPAYPARGWDGAPR